MLNVREILDKRGLEFIDRVRDNIRANDKYVSGQASNSLREDSTEQGLSIYAVDYFETLEKGVAPRSIVVVRDILSWGKMRGIFTQSKEDVFAAMRITRRIIEQGSWLYRKGGAENIYSNEVEPLVRNIADDLGKAITDIQIVKS